VRISASALAPDHFLPPPKERPRLGAKDLDR
jgi:hypothetical protein